MAKTFKNYAKAFDIIYKEKNYQAECEFLTKIFDKYSSKPVRTVLDVACGTGNHIIPLAKMGFQVSAQDISAEMIKIARNKSAKNKLKIKFMGCYPMQEFCHRERFDTIIAMFSSIDYVIKSSELKNTLNNIRKCLKKGGLFVFDFWNKPCVLKSFSPFKRKEFISGKQRVVRVSETSLDKNRSIADVKFTCQYFSVGKLVEEMKELHRMKYYSASEMKKILDSCGYKVIGAFPFMHMNKRITGNDWNISIVASPK